MHEHPLKGQFDEKAADWRRSTNLDGSPGKLEVGFAADGLVGLRTVDDPDTILIYTPEEWDAFVAGAKDGEFDVEVLEEDARQAWEEEDAAAARGESG
ncbi:hypothetical protein Afil01_58440 [Actinorhabdospora filicis]|uniref:DUF397 domain-containing protein n=1 Tax=Actinorhabdospora filicis TaxID=1785913 RepID=A0A9W6W621_9ACTN|nr:DUF397 domain-containing protein [Actinorhabdospora filicis]GLZ81037.1 hypothetical protein Afil01_58440 [Actinorhabdospora filicis]